MRIDPLGLFADQPGGQMQQGAFALTSGDALQASRYYAKAVGRDSNSAVTRHDYPVVLSRLNRAQGAVERLQAMIPKLLRKILALQHEEFLRGREYVKRRG